MYGEVDSFSVIRFAHAVFRQIISLDVGYLIEVRDSRKQQSSYITLNAWELRRT